jgi:hypothetical protein
MIRRNFEQVTVGIVKKDRKCDAGILGPINLYTCLGEGILCVRELVPIDQKSDMLNDQLTVNVR